MPGQPPTERGIDVEFPEHVTGLNEKSKTVEHLYPVSNRNANKRTLSTWYINGDTLVYETKSDDLITMFVSVHLEPGGIGFTYKFINHSDIAKW